MIWSHFFTLTGLPLENTESPSLTSRRGLRSWQEGRTHRVELPLNAEIQPLRQGGTNVQMHSHC